MSHLNKDPNALTEERLPESSAGPDSPSELPANEEITRLREANAAWRAKVEELEQQFAAANQVAQDHWVELQREYETLIEEKSETIRTLHHKNAELREHAARPAGANAPAAPGEEAPDRQELVRLQQEIKEQRRRMEEDEESMMGQLRQMEMALARDRAELARQRAELQRLHDELKHEVDVASRDGGLRERLGALQRAATNATQPRSSVTQNTPPPVQLPKGPLSTPGVPPRSGLFRRIFGARS
jgi:DNA repair exonuclease SbcCD ATPase subunit